MAGAGTQAILNGLGVAIDSIESRVNSMYDDLRDIKSNTADMRDRLSRLEGEFNSARKTDVQVNTAGATGIQGKVDTINDG